MCTLLGHFNAFCGINIICLFSLLVVAGVSIDMRDSLGKSAFEYIRDYEEWIQSRHFSPDILSKLRGENIRERSTCVYM